jgi:hypothetical protein
MNKTTNKFAPEVRERGGGWCWTTKLIISYAGLPSFRSQRRSAVFRRRYLSG